MTSTSERAAHRRRIAQAGPISLRLGLLGLVAVGIAGAVLELAFERHWHSPVQLIPWAALALLVVALVLLALSDAPRTVTAVRVLAGVVLLASAYGVFMHVSVNHGMGSSDAEWDALSPLTQWWYALTKTVGSAPPLAPGMLAQSSLLLLLASLTPRRKQA
ncbi:hypothetical protein MF672_007665 [Actinomadura sp. ATCC 31491]|uniref:Uncharacterized protein n=1 Tax=Actinomadura luzonensis TaxID=2805427 RepID=A0ABT0FMZ7_9ACTN|nr:hypothetical protein [Actinomadura luzonensis]MCK2213667.1 hypothetical protein [Actinomadura luzonensis]